MDTTNNGADYAPAFAPIAVLVAIAFGVWAWITNWHGISVTVLGHPSTLSPGFLTLAGVTLGVTLFMRASARTLFAILVLFAGFGFMWLIAQAAPHAV